MLMNELYVACTRLIFIDCYKRPEIPYEQHHSSFVLPVLQSHNSRKVRLDAVTISVAQCS